MSCKLIQNSKLDMSVAIPEAQELVRGIQAADETAVTESRKKLAEEWLTGVAGRRGGGRETRRERDMGGGNAGMIGQGPTPPPHSWDILVLHPHPLSSARLHLASFFFYFLFLFYKRFNKHFGLCEAVSF